MKRQPIKEGAAIVLGILGALALVIVFSLAWPRFARGALAIDIEGEKHMLLSPDDQAHLVALIESKNREIERLKKACPKT